ncbi:MAG: hypothetical protein Q9224_000634 [Gallowayella concinna]
MISYVLEDVLNTLGHAEPNDDDADRLFNRLQTKIETLALKPIPDSVQSKFISTSRDLEKHLADIDDEKSIHMFFLQQKDTWNKIQVPFPGFQALCRRCDIFRDSAAIIEGFGLKYRPADEYHTFCKGHLESQKPAYAIESKTSIWIAVQASARIKQHLKHAFAAASGRQISLADHLSLHLLFFLELGSKWRAYIKYMEEQLADMVCFPLLMSSLLRSLRYRLEDEKVLHSKVGVAQYVDYSVTFRDTQDLELIRRRLIKASLNLKSNADVGKSWEEETIKLTGHLATNELNQIFVTVRKYITDMYQHARIIDSLLERLDGTQNLL